MYVSAIGDPYVSLIKPVLGKLVLLARAPKNLLANAEDVGLIPGSGGPLEKEEATHPSILAWEILQTEGPGGLPSMESQKSQTWLCDYTTTTVAFHAQVEWDANANCAPGRSLTCTHSPVCSVAQSCPTPCYPKDSSTPGFPVHHQLPELAQTHVHQVGDAIQPSHPLLSPSPPALNLSQHQSLSRRSVLPTR